MKVISLTNEFGLTKGKVYEVLEEGTFVVERSRQHGIFKMARL